MALRMRAGWPTHSKTWSTPLGKPSSFTAATMSSVADPSMKSVAPNCAGHGLLGGVGVDGDDAAGGGDAGRLHRPTEPMPPTPMTATVSPGLHLGPVEHRAGAGDDARSR